MLKSVKEISGICHCQCVRSPLATFGRLLTSGTSSFRVSLRSLFLKPSITLDVDVVHLSMKVDLRQMRWGKAGSNYRWPGRLTQGEPYLTSPQTCMTVPQLSLTSPTSSRQVRFQSTLRCADQQQGLTNHELILSAVTASRVFGNKPSSFTYCNHHINFHAYQQSYFSFCHNTLPFVAETC